MTGYLSFHAKTGIFFQFLEGERGAVLELLDTISADPRHQVINVVHLGKTETRTFPKWSMRYVGPGDLRAVSLEVVLEDVLVRMKQPDYSAEAVGRLVMQVARRIASLQAT